MTTLSLREDQIVALAGLLAGVASADGDFDVFEAEEIGEILADLVPDREVPLEASRLLATFTLDDFSVERACADLALTSQRAKDAVIALMMRVVHADNVSDAKENAFIVAVATELGAQFEEIDMDDVVEIVAPPPFPPPMKG